MLTLVGCEVLVAQNGQEALQLAKEHKPQILFLDLLMPQMDGVTVARKLLSNAAFRSLKIVAHTASAVERLREEALAAGCVDFIVKPIRAEQVYNCLRVQLGVEFDYAAAPPEQETLPPWEPGQITLPYELYARLSIAAELHSTTALKTCLRELRQLGPEAQLLADHIRHLMRSYDMDGVLRLVSAAAEPGASAPDPSNSHGLVST